MPPVSPQTLPEPFFVLASGSPRRREFMEMLGLTFAVITPASPQVTQINGYKIDETPLVGETPLALVQRLSRIKAQAVAAVVPMLNLPPAANRKQIVVIAADTVVVLANKILGKPATPTAAVKMLEQLRQQPHFVYSGLTVTTVKGESRTHVTKLVTRFHQSKVWMRPYTNAEIEAYVASGDPLDKAGAYGIQNQSFAPVARLEGCFASVMGFPLAELAMALKEINVPFPAIAPLCRQHTHHPCCQK